MFCTKCGNQIKDGFKFCPKCGAPTYAEKEKPQGEVKEEKVDKTAKEEQPVLNNEVTSTEKTKEVASKPKKSTGDSVRNSDSVLYPLIVNELDVKGVKKMAEQGNQTAMLRQAYRYEVGIGGAKNIEKAEKLYSQVGGKSMIPELEEISRPTIIPNDH